MKPDYGLKLLSEGTRPEMDLVFYDFPFYRIDIIGPGQYSTMVEWESDVSRVL